MRAYEAMVLLAPTLDDAAAQAVLDRLQRVVVEQGGAVDKLDIWGRRKLAYDIGPHKEAIYAVLYFAGEAGVPRELDRVLRISDEVIRHLVSRRVETPAAAATPEAPAAPAAPAAEA